MATTANVNGEHPQPRPPPPPSRPSTPLTSRRAANGGQGTPPPSQPSTPLTPRRTVNGDHGAPPPLPPPPPGQHHPYYLYPPPSSSSASFRGCCCCLFLFVAFVGLLALAVVLVVVLAVKPKKPQFDLREVTVEYLGLSSPNSATSFTGAEGAGAVPASASMTLRIGMSFTATNQNKVGIKYGESRFTLIYRGVPLGRASVPGFYQPAHSVRLVNTTVAVDRVNLLQAVAADLFKDALVDDRVELRILGDVAAKIHVVTLTSPAVEVSVDCAIVISPKKQSLTYKQCGFDGFNV